MNGVAAFAIKFDENKLGKYERCKVTGYNSQNELFDVKFDNENKIFRVHKLFVCFTQED